MKYKMANKKQDKKGTREKETTGYRLGNVLDESSKQALHIAQKEAHKNRPETRQKWITVYIASDYRHKKAMETLAAHLRENRIGVTSRWLRMPKEDFEVLPDNVKAARIEMDLKDIRTAAVFVAVSPSEFRSSGTGGRHVELGYALQLRKPIVLVGERTNIIHWHPSVRVCGPGFPLEKAIKQAYHSRKRG